jgi:lipopolysaccharide heptosyltransferase I
MIFCSMPDMSGADPQPHHPPGRILVVKPSSLGDIVHTLPLVHALKRSFPATSLGWIVQEAFTDLLRSDPAIDDVYPISIVSTSDPQSPRGAWLQAGRQTLSVLRRLRRDFTARPYDLVLDLHASFRSGLLGRTNPGGVRIGFRDGRELSTFFQNRLVDVPDGVQHALEKNLLFCAQLGCNVAPEDFHMCCSADDEAVVRAFLDRQGLADDQVIIYANPAARWQTKFWPAEHWAGLADRFAGREVTMVFGGSSQDRDFISTITAKMRSRGLAAAGCLTLSQTVALLQRSSLYVGLDSGPMHMAAMCSVPVVALFGPTHPSRVGPYGVEHVLVRAGHLDCLECRKRSCDHLRCMKEISVEMVETAALSLLEKKSVGAP